MYASKQGAVRAIGVEYLWRVVKPIGLAIGLVLGIVYTFVIFAAFQWSSLWLLLLIIIAPITIMFVVILIIIWLMHRIVMPRNLSSVEKTKIHSFIDTIDRLVERSRTPYPLLVFLVAKDVIRGKESKMLTEVIGDSKGVMSEFREIEKLFEPPAVE